MQIDEESTYVLFKESSFAANAKGAFILWSGGTCFDKPEQLK